MPAGPEAGTATTGPARENGFVVAVERRGMDIGTRDHESFRAAVATAAGYGAILAVMTLLLFGVPFLLFGL